MKFESKIAALLDTHLLFVSDAGTKQFIGCKWLMGTVDCTTWQLQLHHQWYVYHSLRKAAVENETSLKPDLTRGCDGASNLQWLMYRYANYMYPGLHM